MGRAIFNFIFDLIRRFLISFRNKPHHVVTYVRELPISLDRMYENAIDWEHLPWLHSTTFSYIEIIESGDWGWKAKANTHPKSFLTSMKLELRLDREKNRWITKTLSGLGKGTEIWTHAIPLEENKIKVIVDFYVPKLPSFLKTYYGKTYEALYAQLYDEDLWMMASRQEEINREHKMHHSVPESSMTLGAFSEIKAQLPLKFEFNHHPYRLIEVDEQLIAHSMSCPHMLGPLEDANIEKGILECPWHGYQFDIHTRKCISGHRCRLAPAPKITVNEDNEVIVLKL